MADSATTHFQRQDSRDARLDERIVDYDAAPRRIGAQDRSMGGRVTAPLRGVGSTLARGIQLARGAVRTAARARRAIGRDGFFSVTRRAVLTLRHFGVAGLSGPLINLPVPPVVNEPLSAAALAAQRAALGRDLPMPVLEVVIGIVTYNTDPAMLGRTIASAAKALDELPGSGRILIIDNGAPSPEYQRVTRLPGQGNVGFGQGHNLLMQRAFSAGADLYIALNPDGALHPDAIANLARVVTAHDGRALVEALQFPAEHPKAYDPISLETKWASGACLAIPLAVFEATGGFDPAFFLYCEDVDLSWRVRAAGMPVLTAPDALFLHAVTNRDNEAAQHRATLASAVLLGRKWGDTGFAQSAAAELVRAGGTVPSTIPEPVPPAWLGIADFSRATFFAPTRW